MATQGIEDAELQPRIWHLVFVCLLLLAGETYLLLNDFDPTERQHRTNPIIAKYQSGLNDVRRKTQGTITWARLESAANLRDEDSLLTMANSYAEVEFLDGSVIKVDAESLVVISKTPADGSTLDKLHLKLVRGSLKRTSAGKVPLSVDLGQGKFVEDRTGTSEFEISKQADGFKVEVQKGLIQFGSQEIKPDESAHVKGEEVEFKKKEEPEKQPSLRAPKIFKPKIKRDESFLWKIFETIGALFWIKSAHGADLAKNVTVELQWEEITEAAAYRLQISKAPDFIDVIIDEKVQGSKFDFKTQQRAQAQTYFYRIASIDGQGNQSEFSNSEVVIIEALAETKPRARPVQVKIPLQSSTEPIPSKPLDESKTVYKFYLELMAGGAIHYRSFIGQNNPKTIHADGFVPFLVEMEAWISRNEVNQLALGGSVLPEIAKSKTTNVSQDILIIPVLRSWILYRRQALGRLFGVGTYHSIAQQLSWGAQQKILVKHKVLLGVALDFTSPLFNTKWTSNASLGVFAFGCLGADLSVSLRNSFFKTFFIEPEILIRLTTIERSTGGLLKLGYAF